MIHNTKKQCNCKLSLSLYLLTTTNPPVDTHKWKQLYKQIMNDIIRTLRCNNVNTSL